MARIDGVIHRKLPPDAVIHTREPEPARTTDEETTSPGFERLGLQAMAEQLQSIARRIENAANPVDEYNSAAVTGAGSAAAVTVQPTYEYMPEKITAIVITGPPAAAVTLQLGDRLWALVIPAAGILPIGPVALMLSRSDARILTPATPGVFTLELMGIADRRFNI
jgi:hypothetical protein